MLELDPELLGLVFYNFAAERCAASPKGGPITIKTRLTDSNAEISVIDRGSGVSPQNKKSISTPSSRRSLMASDWDSPSCPRSWMNMAARSLSRHGKQGSVFHVCLPALRHAAV